jgi:hypothetical protein
MGGLKLSDGDMRMSLKIVQYNDMENAPSWSHMQLNL